MVPDFVDDLALALDGDCGAVLLAQNALNGVEAVRLAGRRSDASISEPAVGGKSLEEADGAGEEVGGFLGGLVVGVAAGLQSADAGTVLAPFVLPEALVIALVVLPVGLHIAEGIGSLAGQDVGDVGVGTVIVALSGIGAVAVVRPETVDGPRIWGMHVSKIIATRPISVGGYTNL